MINDSKIETVPVFKTDKNQLMNQRNRLKIIFITVISFIFIENRTDFIGFEILHVMPHNSVESVPS
jgi:hypothetical protein